MKDNCILGIDVGTTSMKVIMYDCEGRVIATGCEEYNLLTPKKNIVELNPEIYSAKNTSGVSLKIEALRCLIVDICYNKSYEIQEAESCSILHEILHSDIDQIPKENIR